MLDRFFRLREHGTSVRTESLAGLTTFLTMAYIIVVQPMVLSGRMFGMTPEIMDFDSVTAATCVAAAIATGIMALYARYPIAQAPGMGQNFFFVFSAVPAASAWIAQQAAASTIEAGQTSPWQIALGVVFISGILFLILSLLGVREALLESISPSMRHGIAVGIGLFIAFIGLRNASLILPDKGTTVKLNPHFLSPDLIVFFFGLLLTAGLQARRVRGAIIWGIVAATLLACLLKFGLPYLPEDWAKSDAVAKSGLNTRFAIASAVVSAPPSMSPTFLKMDLVHACSWPMVPFILIFLFMVVFDTLGTLVGVSERAGLIKDNKLPRVRQAFMADALGSVVGAACGTSTVTSFIESAAGVEQGGRTGLTALVVAILFLVAMVFSPLINMVGSYPPITAPALVIIGAMMCAGVAKIDWSNYAEAMPAFLVMLGIPLSYSIGDGLALGFISYPVVKLSAGQGRDVKWLMYVMALVLVAYFVTVRASMG